MATSDQPFERALLYLRAAGHDTGDETRARLQQLLRAHRDESPSLRTELLLDQIALWFDLRDPGSHSQQPFIARASIGYPNG